MDKKGLRTLNIVGTILYGLIGSLLALVYYYETYEVYIHFNRDLTECTIILFIWFSILTIFTSLLYEKTVVALDQDDFKTAKQWTLVGIIIGFMGGIIPLIIFIISYVSFDDAIRTHLYGPVYHYHPQSQSQNRDCTNCKKQIPFDSRLCPYCGLKQDPIYTKRNPPPPPPPPKLRNRKIEYY